MMKIGRKASTTLSLALAVIFLAVLIFSAVIMPWLVNVLVDTRESMGTDAGIGETEQTLLLVLAYAVIAIALVADFMLLALLRNIRRCEVFTSCCVSLIRGISWCLIFFGIVFLPIGLYFQLAFGIAFAGIFMGLCVRVVKNAFEEAVAIKEENDLTV